MSCAFRRLKASENGFLRTFGSGPIRPAGRPAPVLALHDFQLLSEREKQMRSAFGEPERVVAVAMAEAKVGAAMLARGEVEPMRLDYVDNANRKWRLARKRNAGQKPVKSY